MKDESVFYNEWDKNAAQWLRNLVAAGQLPQGVVNDQDIRKLTGQSISGYKQAHFFAGIGGWPLALRLAGWPDDREVWTASCPCQPFSCAGRGKGFNDERDLWPVFFPLIPERKPETIFGEQVASKDGLLWLDRVYADLEGAGYAVAAFDICAAGVSAPHIRQRLYWVAHRFQSRLEGQSGDGNGREESGREYQESDGPTSEASSSGDGMGFAAGIGRQPRRSESSGPVGIIPPSFQGNVWGVTIGIWQDGTARRFEPGILPLAHGVPGRVGLIRGYGNAIVPPLAVEFIKAFMEAVEI